MKTAQRFEPGEKVDYYVEAAFRWNGLAIRRAKTYCHGFVKLVRGRNVYVKPVDANRIDVVRPRQIFGKLERRDKCNQ